MRTQLCSRRISRGAGHGHDPGIPAEYQPYLAPINNTPGTPTFGNNNVTVTLNNGTQVVTAYAPAPSATLTSTTTTATFGANPFSKTILLGPFNYMADVSLYKEFALTERMRLRLNLDAFNAFNIQGRVNPNTSDGIESLQTSYWSPRQIQITARLSF